MEGETVVHDLLKGDVVYDNRELEPAMLDQTVGELRAQLELDVEPRPTTWRDRLAFAGAVAALELAALVPVAFFAFLLFY